MQLIYRYYFKKCVDRYSKRLNNRQQFAGLLLFITFQSKYGHSLQKSARIVFREICLFHTLFIDASRNTGGGRHFAEGSQLTIVTATFSSTNIIITSNYIVSLYAFDALLLIDCRLPPQVSTML